VDIITLEVNPTSAIAVDTAGMGMADTKASIKGGEKASAFLTKLEAQLANPPTIKVGFLDGSTYPNGRSVAANAALQEFGGTITRSAHEQTIFRKVSATGFLKKGKFVKASQSNFATKHAVAASSITIPPRPFFRNMINKNQSDWGPMMSTLLRDKKYDLKKAAGSMGQVIKGQLQASIISTNSPPNSPSTIRRKGSAAPLIDTGFMISRVDFSVD
jgi:hypothetical protein